MCLIFFSWKTHPKYKLVLVANRDEFYNRPTAKAALWPEKGIFAGQDLKAQGTWLGIQEDGKFGALTNYRDPALIREDVVSRGKLLINYLQDEKVSPDRYLTDDITPEKYNPFNLLVGNKESIFYYNNVEKTSKEIESGTFGLSNAFLDSNWPKVIDGKKKLQELVIRDEIDKEALFEIMVDKSLAPDNELPSTGVPYDWEKQLSAKFIETEGYGTRCTSVILMDYDNNISFFERTYSNGYLDEKGEVSWQFEAK